MMETEPPPDEAAPQNAPEKVEGGTESEEEREREETDRVLEQALDAEDPPDKEVKKPKDKKPEDKKPVDKKPVDKKPEEKKPEDKKPESEEKTVDDEEVRVRLISVFNYSFKEVFTILFG
jgi:hypothetical protein